MVNKYDKKNKEKLQKEARERYPNLSEEEKDKKRKYAQERFLLKKKNKKGVSIIKNVSKSYLSI